ncbi:MAG: glutamate-5-semialdehyde dehydrogenase, partial [Clostridia bacterium]|nr:glutamate-5-semialdehyde dehydrogenase [Clostridia bacterium]
MANAARQAALTLAIADATCRNKTLLYMADTLASSKETIFTANHTDLAQAEEEGLSGPLLKRLVFGEEKLGAVIQGLKDLAALPDPLGHTTLSRELMPDLHLYRITCPIGVIGVIFESRPDALVQIASLALKSGNAVLLKGGREALHTNQVLCDCLRRAACAQGLPADFAQLLQSREDVSEMLKEDDLIDLIIPRGSKSFVRFIMDNSRIPVLGHADGICHVYLDRDADLSTAVSVAVDSKVQNVAVCNAMETLLVHQDIANQVLPILSNVFTEKGVTLLGDPETVRIINCFPANDKDWETEYLDYTLSVRIVESVDQAIDHINHYGSHHTDCI